MVHRQMWYTVHSCRNNYTTFADDDNANDIQTPIVAMEVMTREGGPHSTKVCIMPSVAME